MLLLLSSTITIRIWGAAPHSRETSIPITGRGSPNPILTHQFRDGLPYLTMGESDRNRNPMMGINVSCE